MTGRPDVIARGSDAPLPTVGASAPGPGLARRVFDVAVVAALITAWLGLIEAALLCLFRHVPEPALFLRRAAAGYAGFGFVLGIGLGLAAELITRRHGRWRRR